jgi:hypothetical protein
MQEQLMAVIKMLHKLFVSSQLKVSQNRNRTDLFASRVLKNMSAPNLISHIQVSTQHPPKTIFRCSLDARRD